MEHIGEILRQIQKNSTSRDSGISSGVESDSSLSSCPICNGAKFVYPRLPSGKPDYSRVVPCGCSNRESDRERQARLQQQSNLGSLARLSFANLLPRGRSEDTANQEMFSRGYEAARAFAAQPREWLVLSGPSGCGKTHLAAAIANQCIENNRPVFYVTAPDLLDHLRATFSPSSEIPYDELFQQVRNTPLLILDELGVQSSTPWAKEKLEQLLSHRYSSQLPTVIVSILPLDELEERVRTRLVASEHYELCAFGESSPDLLSSGWAPQFKKQMNMTFENFDWKRGYNLPVEQRENLKAAYELAQDFARESEGWLVFQGVNGCGKTHLAAAIVNYRYQNKQPALFIVVPDFLDHLRSTFSPESKVSYDRLFETVRNAPLLVLDDFGKQATSPWAQEKLYQVINHRYNAQLPTVVTTNCSTDEMDSPISSRFVDPKISTLFHITAPHYAAAPPAGPRRASHPERRER